MEPVIHITPSYPEVLFKGFEHIRNYYPVGLPIENHFYSGYQKLKAVIGNKINQILDHTLPENITNLISGLKDHSRLEQVRDECYLPFPDYSISVVLIDDDNPERHYTCRLRIKLSLLGNFYTIFYDNTFHYKHFRCSLSGTLPIICTVLSGSNEVADADKRQFLLANELVNSYFFDYEFIPHNMLLNYPVTGGHPHGTYYDNGLRQYYFYDFLFDGDYWQPIKIPGNTSIIIAS